MRPPIAATLFAVFAALAVAACRDDGDEGGSGLSVVATTPIIGALAWEVGGNDIALSTVMKPGVDPHEFDPSASDLRRIGRAKVVLRNGLGLDDFVNRAISGVGGSARVVTVTDGIELRTEGGEVDPHAWHDPANVQVMVRNIAAALAEADSAHAGEFQARADAYNRKLDDVDRQVRALIDSIPPGQRKMVSNHDAFGYFIRRYNITFVGAVLPGLSTQTQPSAKEIADLVDLIKREGVKAIFAEETIEPKVARQIARDTGVKIVDDLYGDSLGDKGSGADTVDGMLLSNARKIAEALK